MQHSSKIEILIAKEDWAGARKVITQQLKYDPSNHWLLTRLSLTFYEQKKYGVALKIVEHAFAVNSCCPLVLWDYAGTLDMLGRKEQAIKIYKSLIRRGAQSIAYDECGEGLRRAKGLIADCHYRIARCYKYLGKFKSALTHFQKHLKLRGSSTASIYPIKRVREEIVSLRLSTARPATTASGI